MVSGENFKPKSTESTIRQKGSANKDEIKDIEKPLKEDFHEDEADLLGNNQDKGCGVS